jgi:raffinose/stachyose/melibiose transport system substrate-binding protein
MTRTPPAAFSRRTLLWGAVLAVGVGTAACAPGGSSNSGAASSASSSSAAAAPASPADVAKAGKVTLTVWDQNSDGGIAKAQQKLNQEFTAKYPNVTIKRNTQSFSDLKTTLKLALSGSNPPDVVQANQGYPDMGAFVQAGLLQPVDKWAKAYGWTSRIPPDLLAINTFTPDGKTWEKGNLYGVSQTGEIVGLYYNKKLLQKAGLKAPTTFAQLQADLPKIKAAGMLPLQYGDSDKTPGIHIYGVALSAVAGSKAATDLVTSAGGAWTDPAPLQAAQVVAGWAKAGYLTPGANGISKDTASKNFGKGQGVFHFDGTWRLDEMQTALGKNVGFVALAGKSGKPETLGGEGLAWSMTSKTKHPDVAAAYIDFVTNENSAKVLVDTGNLPLVLPAGDSPAAGTVSADITRSWKSISTGGGLVPYLDYATTTFYDTLTAAVQQLTGGQQSPQKFTQTLQKDAAAFQKSK